MFTISYEIKRLPEFDQIQARFLKSAQSFALEWEALVKRKLSGEVLNVRSGALRSSIGHEVIDNGDSISVRVFSSNVPYAGIHEHGGKTSAHEIVPTKAQALHFIIAGKEIFARRVHHPGSKIPQRSYIRSALAELMDKDEVTG